jgi:hypothetical protein
MNAMVGIGDLNLFDAQIGFNAIKRRQGHSIRFSVSQFAADQLTSFLPPLSRSSGGFLTMHLLSCADAPLYCGGHLSHSVRSDS